MSTQPAASASAPPPAPGDHGHDSLRSRPWTPAAAMEPVPPLAPPPARPGAGTRVSPGERPAATGGRARAVLVMATIVLIAFVLVMLLVSGHL